MSADKPARDAKPRRPREPKPEAARPAASQDAARLLHELQVHQVELEAQNEELRAARAEVEAGLERYRDLYEFAPVGYLTLTPEGSIVEVNLTGAALLGTERSRLLRRGLGRFVPPEDLVRWDQYLATLVRSTERQACELSLQREDGSRFHARFVGILQDRLSSENPAAAPIPALRVALSDITEHKLIDDTHLFLSQSGSRPLEEDFFRSLARYLAGCLNMDAVFIERIVGDGRISRTLARYDRGAFLDNVESSLKDTPCGDVAGKTTCCFPRSVRRLFPENELLQSLRAESYVGATLWSFDGKPIGLIAVIGRTPLARPHVAEWVLKLVSLRAAGELQRAEVEEALRASDRRYRSFMDVTGQLGWTTNAAGEVTEDLPSWRKYTGQTFQEIRGWGWSEVLHPDDLARTSAAWRAAVAGRRSYEIEYRIRRHDGVYRHFLARGVPVFGDRGEVLEWVGICIDITDRKQSEETLRQAAVELERSNKDLDQFTTSATHDLQEPLRAVAGYTHLLQARYLGRLDEQADSLLAGAYDGAARMQRMIDDLLAYARVGTIGEAPKPVPAALALDAALANLATAVEETGAVVTRDPLPEVVMDHAQLELLFQNLVGNAIKFHADRALRIHIGAARQPERWLFSVRDNGIGIDPEQRERIFGIFQRLHSRGKYPGTGIGLATCKRIVERYGGRIWVESEPDRGSTFFFSVPVGGET